MGRLRRGSAAKEDDRRGLGRPGRCGRDDHDPERAAEDDEGQIAFQSPCGHQDISNPVTYKFDPMNPEAQLVYHQISAAIENPGVVRTTVIKPFEQKGTRYIDFLIPGLMAMGVMMSSMLRG